jgi:hypothetical protein
MQLVAGLMYDKYSNPMTIELFDDNKLDCKTVHNQNNQKIGNKKFRIILESVSNEPLSKQKISLKMIYI